MNRSSGGTTSRSNTRATNNGRQGGAGRGAARGGRGSRNLPIAATRGRTNATSHANRGPHPPPPPPPPPPRTMVDPAAALNALATTATASRRVIQRIDPLLEEDEFDRQNKTAYPGPADSEDEEDDDNDVLLDRMLHADDNAAIDDNEYVESSELQSTPFFLWGCPPGWKPPTAPPEWVAPPPKTDLGEPEFEDVDNPGKWSDFTFRARFNKRKKEYAYHAMPTGATPVPIDPATGTRSIEDWTFHYGGWHRDFEEEEDTDHDLNGLPVFRSGAVRGEMFPVCRKGSLSGPILKQLGMTTDRMQDKEGFPDALFFYQLLLPTCDTAMNNNDPRMSFYLDVSRYSNAYANVELGLGTGFGHAFRPVTIPELLRWDGTVVQDGVRGGSDGALFRRFDKSKYNTAFDRLITVAFTKSRWLEIKRVYKLCNNLTAAKKGEEGYDPAYKYDLIYKVLVHNVNAITQRCGLDMCGDETSWGHQGFGEAGTGIVGQILGKPGISKGGQTVIVSDVDRLRPRAYVH
jgi:hypothetical protein